MSKFNELRKLNVNEHTEKKDGLTYLSWAWAWDTFKQHCPDATYEILKNNGLPYFETSAGAMVYTKVTANGETHEMWLPVMDGKNKAMKSEQYKYTVRDYKTKQPVEKTVDAFTMFDVNKTLMRCLVKNLAMFGLGLYIYSGEDLPESDPIDMSEYLNEIEAATNVDELKAAYIKALNATNGEKSLKEMVIAAKDAKKASLK
jgi:hypothetical protein